MKPLSDDERKRVGEICPEAVDMADFMELDDEDRENGMDEDTPCVCITPKDAKAITRKLLAQDAEIKELKDVLEAEGYRFPEREFPDEEPSC